MPMNGSSSQHPGRHDQNNDHNKHHRAHTMLAGRLMVSVCGRAVWELAANVFAEIDQWL